MFSTLAILTDSVLQYQINRILGLGNYGLTGQTHEFSSDTLLTSSVLQYPLGPIIRMDTPGPTEQTHEF